MTESTPAQRKKLLEEVVKNNEQVGQLQEKMYTELRAATAKRRNSIQEAHDAGIPKNQIATELGVSPQRLRMLLKGGPR